MKRSERACGRGKNWERERERGREKLSVRENAKEGKEKERE